METAGRNSGCARQTANKWSFGTWNENEWNGEFDSLGNCDDEVFFYCEDGEEELKSLVGTSNEDFVVLSYDIDYTIPLVLADMEVEQ